MDFSNFQKFLEKASNFSDKAVISLSLWGEPLLHPDFSKFVKAILENPKFSVLIETSGENLSLNSLYKIPVKESSIRKYMIICIRLGCAVCIVAFGKCPQKSDILTSNINKGFKRKSKECEINNKNRG